MPKPGSPTRPRILVPNVDPEELEMALGTIRRDTDALREFLEGVRDSSGTVNPAKTEGALRAFLEINEFSPEAIHFAVRLSPHAVHPLSSAGREALDEAARRKLGHELSLNKIRGKGR